jgi:Kef-type K+ transport system membrane component KefB
MPAKGVGLIGDTVASTPAASAAWVWRLSTPWLGNAPTARCRQTGQSGWNGRPSWFSGRRRWRSSELSKVSSHHQSVTLFGSATQRKGRAPSAAFGTVLALGIVFAHFDVWLAFFGGATAAVLAILPRLAPWFFNRIGHHVSEPETKFVAVILLALGGLATIAGSEAVLPAYLVGMALAPVFVANPELPHRMRIIAFTILTPFYFLKAGSLIDFHAVLASAGLILVFLTIKMATKFVGILPLTRAFRFERREGMYTTLLMSTGLTFGTISALFGLTNGIIDQRQYTILVTAVIGSAVVPTLIAQRWFQPVMSTPDGSTKT